MMNSRHAIRFVALLVLPAVVAGCTWKKRSREFVVEVFGAMISGAAKEVVVHEDLRRIDDGFLVEAMESESPGLSRRAALALGRIQDPATAPALIGALNGPARREAIFALGQMGLGETWDPTLATPITLALLEAGAASSPEERALICQSLGRLGDPAAVPFLAAALGAPDSAVRQAAAIALGRLKHPDVLVPLGAHVGDADPEVRWRLAWALAFAADPKAEDGVKEAVRVDLRQLLVDTNATARAWACRGLGKLAMDQDWAALSRLSRDPDWMVRVEAYGALEKLVLPDPAGALPTPLPNDDPSVHVRAAAARVWAMKSDLASLQNIKDASEVRCAALEGWAKVHGQRTGEGSLAVFKTWAADQDPLVRAAVVSACASFGDAQSAGSEDRGEVALTLSPRLECRDALGITERALGDADVRVRASAAEGLGAFKSATARQALLKSLADPDLAVRGSAVGALETIGGAEVVDPLIACFHNCTKREHVEVKEAIVDALTKIEDDRVNPFLLEACRDAQPSVRAKAVKALRARNQEVPSDIPPPPPPEVSPFMDRALALAGKPAPVVEIVTSKGTMKARLDPEAAPIHVANVLDLVGKKFYDGLRWHRVVPNFVIQGGDPRGDGWGDAGYSIRDEISDRPYLRGTIGMPKAGKDTGGCQIFIMHSPAPHLDGRYTVFGQVIEGLEVIDRIEVGDRIERVRVVRGE
ncbi:MAG: HEAT repeat domain-containing protein [Planctomycetes bacterium]|nr:HEAT repeat domain-containing protein [Planctomycetota bacterium]